MESFIACRRWTNLISRPRIARALLFGTYLNCTSFICKSWRIFTLKIGYGRVSTTEQVASIIAQEAQLKKEGCEEIFSEMMSAVGDRPQLERALAYVHKGDILCVTKLVRLARSVAHLCQLVAALKAKGVALHVLDMGLATNTPTGELMVNLLGSIAQFERSCMLERQRSGIEAARRAGKYKGRKASARAQTANIIELA